MAEELADEDLVDYEDRGLRSTNNLSALTSRQYGPPIRRASTNFGDQPKDTAPSTQAACAQPVQKPAP